MDEGTLKEPTCIKLSIEEVIAFLKLCEASNKRPLVMSDGQWLHHCRAFTYGNLPMHVDVGCHPDFRGDGQIRMTFPKNAEYDRLFRGEFSNIIYILQKYSGCSAELIGSFDLSAVTLGNATVFKTKSWRYYMYAEDIPEEEFEHAVEVPYNVGMRVNPHRITSLVKSANKQ